MRMRRPVVVRLNGIPRWLYRKFRARIRVQATRMTLLNDTGGASFASYTVEWVYSEPEQTLTVTCTKRPLWASEDAVTCKIRNFAEAL